MSSPADEFWETFGEWANDADGNALPCSVKTNDGEGSHGAILSDPKDRPGLIQIPQGGKLTRSNQGDLFSASTVLCVPFEQLGDFTLGSLVTPADGHEAPVMAVAIANTAEMFQFVQVTLG